MTELAQFFANEFPIHTFIVVGNIWICIEAIRYIKNDEDKDNLAKVRGRTVTSR